VFWAVVGKVSQMCSKSKPKVMAFPARTPYQLLLNHFLCWHRQSGVKKWCQKVLWSSYWFLFWSYITCVLFKLIWVGEDTFNRDGVCQTNSFILDVECL
jgi:hypothetical protein